VSSNLTFATQIRSKGRFLILAHSPDRDVHFYPFSQRQYLASGSAELLRAYRANNRGYAIVVLIIALMI
jgi:hypothetical protein